MTFKTIASILSAASSENSSQKGALSSCILKSFAKAERARHAFGSQSSSSKTSPSLSISEEPPRFFTAKLFSSTNVVQCSYEELAKIQNKTKRGVIEQVKKDIANGYIYKELTSYKCKKYKPLLHGKNIYRLTDKGRVALGRPPVDGGPTEKEKQEAAQEKALSKAVLTFFSSDDEDFAFEQLKKECPAWWFADPLLFKTTLSLLKQKLSKKYRVRSIPRWISNTLQEGGVGFRRRVVRKWRKAIYSKTNTFKSASPYVQAVFEQLRALALKERLDVSEKALMKLFRKGADHLGIVLRVYDKARKVRQIKNLNAFLNWLVSFKEPFDFFNKRDVPVLFQYSFKEMEPLAVIKWAKKQLLSIKDRCVFIKKSEKPSDPQPDKFYVDFSTHKTDPLKSYLWVYFYCSGVWVEDIVTLKVKDFRERLLGIFFKNHHKNASATSVPASKEITPALASVIKWAKEQLIAIKNRCEFLPKREKPSRPNPDKFYVHLATYEKQPLRSYLWVYFYWSDGFYSDWTDAFISINAYNFQEQFSAIFFKSDRRVECVN